MNRFKYMLKVLFKPGCWLQNNEYNEAWDTKLNKLMSDHKFVLNDGQCTARLGNTLIWIANHPYASFSPYNSIKVRPKRTTLLKAFDKLTNDIL